MKNIPGSLKMSLICMLGIVTFVTNAQNDKSFTKKYLTKLPSLSAADVPARYTMTAVYTDEDIFGNFSRKTRVAGEYTSGLPGDSAAWNNVFISSSTSKDQDFPEGTKLNYMEGFKYFPSPLMVTEKEAFSKFPSTPENVFARNLIWDMYSFETYAWMFYDSLKLNIPYVFNKAGEFNMAEIGNYSHDKMIITWVGITTLNNELCSVIEFTTTDNRVEISMDMVKTKGTEQYWGTIFVSAKTRRIERGVMYSGTVQQIEMEGMKDSFIVRTVRELEVNRIM